MTLAIPITDSTTLPNKARFADTTMTKYVVYIQTPVAGIVAVGADAGEEADWDAAVLAADPLKLAAFKASIKAQIVTGQTSVLRTDDF